MLLGGYRGPGCYTQLFVTCTHPPSYTPQQKKLNFHQWKFSCLTINDLDNDDWKKSYLHLEVTFFLELDVYVGWVSSTSISPLEAAPERNNWPITTLSSNLTRICMVMFIQQKTIWKILSRASYHTKQYCSFMNYALNHNQEKISYTNSNRHPYSSVFCTM